MKARSRIPYHVDMVATIWRRALAGLLSLFVFLGFDGSALAQSQLPSTGSPFVVVQLDSGAVTVHTWTRPTVGIEADPSITYNHAPPRIVEGRMRQQSIMLWSQTIKTQQGEQLSLPPEPFPLPPFAPGDHDAYIVRGEGDVTLDVPESTPLIVINIKLGTATVEGYHGTLVAHIGGGQVHLNDDSGTVAAQVNNGPFFANNSNFERIRLRTGRGNILMTNCRASQIAVTSLMGSILFDNGSFDNGIARFETDRGIVAIGVNGAAQIEAHSGNGRIVLDNGDAAVQRSASDAQATFEAGGPVVTASSTNAAVFLFRGSLRDHPNLLRQLPPRARFF
jgi:hypothetical protein